MHHHNHDNRQAFQESNIMKSYHMGHVQISLCDYYRGLISSFPGFPLFPLPNARIRRARYHQSRQAILSIGDLRLIQLLKIAIYNLFIIILILFVIFWSVKNIILTTRFHLMKPSNFKARKMNCRMLTEQKSSSCKNQQKHGYHNLILNTV